MCEFQGEVYGFFVPHRHQTHFSSFLHFRETGATGPSGSASWCLAAAVEFEFEAKMSCSPAEAGATSLETQFYILNMCKVNSAVISTNRPLIGGIMKEC